MSTTFTKAWRVGWAPSAVVALHSALAAIIGHRRDLDPVFHFLGGVAGAYGFLEVIELFPRTVPVAVGNRWLVAIVAVSVVALLWESAEFASDRVFGSRIQLGWRDTWMDLALGVGGAVVGAALGAVGRRQTRRR